MGLEYVSAQTYIYGITLLLLFVVLPIGLIHLSKGLDSIRNAPWWKNALAMLLTLAVIGAIDHWQRKSSPEAKARAWAENIISSWEDGNKQAVGVALDRAKGTPPWLD